MLYASAQVDRHRALQLSDAIRSGFQQLGVFQSQKPDARGTRPVRTTTTGEADPAGEDRLQAATATDFTVIQSELQDTLAAQLERNEMALHMGADGLVVTLREAGFFDSGSATIKPGAEKAIARVAAVLREHSCTLRIEGHTDNVPIQTAQFASNWELSTARASGLVRSLVDKYGLSPGLLSAAGYAEFHPASTNDTVKGRQLNRRVALVILRAAGAQATVPQIAQGNKPEDMPHNEAGIQQR